MNKKFILWGVCHMLLCLSKIILSILSLLSFSSSFNVENEGFLQEVHILYKTSSDEGRCNYNFRNLGELMKIKICHKRYNIKFEII